MDKKKTFIYLIITIVGAFAACFGINMFNSYVLMSLPLILRMILMVVTYWVIALVPIVIMVISKMSLESIVFKKESIGSQIVTGIIFGIVVASAYFLVPYFLGFGELVDNGSRYTMLWQFAFEYFYFVVAVGAVEELIFRGIIYQQLMKLVKNEWGVIIVSSVIFGLFHMFTGYVIQILMTTIIGFIFAVIRYKNKRCTLLSLVFLHGTYDFMLMLYSSLLF